MKTKTDDEMLNAENLAAALRHVISGGAIDDEMSNPDGTGARVAAARTSRGGEFPCCRVTFICGRQFTITVTQDGR